MIEQARKCPTDVRQRVADIVYKNADFRGENFPLCTNLIDVSKALACSDSWYVLVADRPIALFNLERSESRAKVSRICATDDSPVDTVISCLRQDLRKMGITDLIARVESSDLESLTAAGFEKGESYVRFSRVAEETKMMPILPLANATQKELPALSRLMYDAYAKEHGAFSDIQSAESSLRTLMSGKKSYLSEASFTSGTSRNLVSACLVTLNSTGQANIAQLFTHPLYRARGLATTEIGATMNWLVRSSIPNLVAWPRESNDVVKRLLLKMGFREDRRAVELAARI